MSLIKLLIEGRKEMFMSKFANKFSPEQLQGIINTSDVIPNQDKFLNFIGNVVNTKNFKDDLSIVVKLLQKFSTLGSNLEKKDINQYQSIRELKDALLNYENRTRREVKKVEGADIIYEDDKIIMVHPKTYQASCHYGAGTKWCTTSSSSTFDSYQKDRKLFYIIDKKKPTSDRFYKIAILHNFDGSQIFYDAPDKSFKPENVIPKNMLDMITARIEAYIQGEYLDEYNNYLEREKEKIEYEKKRRRAEQIRLAEIREAQQERRETQEWDLELYPDDDIAIMANALFTYFVSNNIIDPLTTKDIQDKIKLEEELSRLMEIYENTENANENTDLVADISAIEDEISDINKKEDIYVLIPEEYGHYGLTSFSYNDEKYAIGTESEFDNAAYDVQRGIVDELGISAFNSHFVENFIDEDDVRDYIRDFFSEDVYQNPEIYLSDDDRQLSRAQLENIKELESEWESLNEKESETEDEDEIQEISDRIEEIKDDISDIEQNPDGDFSEEKIEEAIDAMVDEYRDNIRSFVSNYIGADYTEFIQQFVDMEELIKGVVEADGYGPSLNSYDGDYETQRFSNTTYYIIRYE